MADIQAPEKLLRGMTVEGRIASGNGVACYELTHQLSGQRFVLKHISLPASEEKLEALLLTGAYADRDEAGRYYQHMVEDLVREIRCNRALADCPNILRFLSYQLIPRESSVGFDLYTITARKLSLREFCQNNAMSHLQALNLGIDICTALDAIHEAGFVFQDLRPGNIFMDENGSFLLGDFGLAPMQDMQYSSLPEQFMSEYSAPELGGVLTGLNKTIDIYSLGMLLYRIYNGYHAPFEDEQTGVSASEERRRSGEALPAPLYADYELAGILGKACAFRPEDRYQTPAELRDALAEYLHRNEADDSLIVPPIVSSDEPLLEDLPDDEPEPVRFANVEELDESFKTHFAPDTASLKAVIEAVRKEEERSGKHDAEAAPEEAGDAPDAPDAPSDEGAPEELRDSEPEKVPPVSAKMPTLEPEQPAKAKKTEGKPKKPGPAPKKDEPAPEKSAEKPAPKVKAPRPTAAERKKARKAKKAARKRAMRQAGKKPRHIGGWIVFSLIALVVAAFLLYCFTPLGHNWYEFDIVVDKLDVVETTTDAITVEIASNAEPGLLTASCQDAYGNAFTKAVDEQTLTFEGLTPGTSYTVSLSLEGFHRLSGVTNATAATVAQTELLSFTATASPEEGAAALSLVVKEGADEPEQWTVQIEAAGEEARTETFSGHSATVGGLTVGTEYSFRLLDPEGYTLIGQREAVYTPLPVVTAEDLALTGLLDGVATLSWRCTSQLPEAWNLSLEGPEGEPAEQQIPETDREPEEDGSYLCTAQISGVEVGKNYLFRVGADGMYQSLSVTLDENVPYIADFSAEIEDDAIRLRWDSAFVPEGGWTLRILPDGNEEAALPQVVVTENGYELVYSTDDEVPTLLPDTNYLFELRSGSGETLFGHTAVEARSNKAAAFTDLRIDIMSNYTGLYRTPEGDDWDAETLMKRDRQTRFTADDSIEILLRNRSGVTSSDMEVDVLILLRDADGKLVSYDMSRMSWNEMWTSRNWALHLPHTPQAPGTYTVEIYVNQKRIVTSEPLSFTITES